MAKENYDCHGWATQYGVLCGDGRTIMHGAFADQDGATVPLIWNHNHDDPADVLGHALLEARPEGMYTYCKFNDTKNGRTAKELVKTRILPLLVFTQINCNTKVIDALVMCSTV